jgi:phage terminase large subunit-like protein
MPAKKVAGPKNTVEAFRLLSEQLKTQAVRPNIHGYKPHAKQVAFHSSDAKARLYIGGNRSGKTTGGIAEDIFWLTGRHPYRVTPPPPIRGRIVSTSFLDGVEKVVRPELARWLPPSELLGGSWSSAYNKELRTLTLDNGSFVEFMSYDQELDKFAGTSRHFIHFDEEPPQDIWLENRTRLVDTGGSYWITMTPVEGMTWIYDDIYMAAKTDSKITVIEVDMTENPYLHPGEVDEFISGLSADDREARVRGKFVQVGGLIYKHFDPNKHVIDPVDPRLLATWEWYASLDHGFNNPTAWLWHAVSPDGKCITFAEHYVSGEVVDYHAKAVHEKNASLGRVPDVYVGDPSIRNIDPITGTSIHLEYSKLGIPIVLANNDVVAGINRVASYLDSGNLLITRNCQNLIQELLRYRWKTWASKRIGQQNNNHEVAHKKNDHAADSLRYFIMSRPDLRPISGMPSAPKNPLSLSPAASPYKDTVVPEIIEPENRTEWHTETADEYMGGYW